MSFSFNSAFLQWAFAAAPGHPLLKSVLDTALPRIIAQDFDLNNQHFVHSITGPAMYTRGLRNVLLADVDMTGTTLKHMRASRDADWRLQGICILTRADMSIRLKNGYGSQGNGFLDSPTWSSWTKDADALHRAGALAS